MGYDPIVDVQLDDVTENELRAKGVISLATRPNAPSRYGEGGLTAEALKAKFDGLARALADRINNIHKYLRADDLAENIKVDINAVGESGIQTLAALAEAIESGEAAKYFNVEVGANGYKSLQEALNGILENVAGNVEDIAGAVARVELSFETGREQNAIRITAYNKDGDLLAMPEGTDVVLIPNAEYLVYDHNESTDSHQDIRGLIQSNGMQIDSLREDIADVRVVAEGRVRARAYRTWNDALIAISSFGLEDARKEFAIGDQIYIRTPKSTDAWVSGFETRREPYPGGHGDDLDPFEMLASTEIHVGYLILSPLEAPDVDLTGYVTTDDFDEYGEKVDKDIADAKAHSVAEAKSYTAEEVAGVSDRVETIDKKVENLRAALSPEYFATDSSVAYSKTVPASALPFAEVQKIGGMTKASRNLLDAMHMTDYFTGNPMTNATVTDNGRRIEIVGDPTGSYNAINFKFTAGKTYCATYGGTGKLGYVGAPASAYPINSGVPFTVADGAMGILCFGSDGGIFTDLMIVEGGEAQEFAPYGSGLISAAVTALESVGVNILDISAALNSCLTDNGDGTYTITRKTSSDRFSATFPLYIPVNGRIYTYVEIVTSYDGFSGSIPLQIFGEDGKTEIGAASLANNGSGFALANGSHYARLYLNTNAPIGVSVTFRKPMVKYGTAGAPYAPYVKRTYPIPAEAQALDGWGEGISADCHNRIDWGKKQYRQEVAKIRIDGSEEWNKSTASNIFQASAALFPIAGDTKKNRPVISNGYGFSDWYNPDASIKPYFRITQNTGTLWIEATLEQFASVDAWKAYLSANPVEIVYPLASPIVTDLPGLPDDNFIEVEGGGTVTAVNEHELAAPTKIEYQLKEATA